MREGPLVPKAMLLYSDNNLSGEDKYKNYGMSLLQSLIKHEIHRRRSEKGLHVF